MASFHAFGLEIESDLDIPEFPLGLGTATDVTISYGAVGSAPQDAVAISRWANVSPGGVWLAFGTGDRFLITGGNSIIINPSPHSSAAERRVHLLASAFGALLQQRGLLTLHCGAVAISDRVMGVMGPSGIGKSTTTSGLVAGGHPLVTDDILAVDVSAVSDVSDVLSDASGEPGDSSACPVAIAAFPSMKLCHDVLLSRGEESCHERVPSPRNKYRVPTPNFETKTLPLGTLFLLRRRNQDSVTISPPLPNGKAFRVLARQTFRPRFIAPMGRQQQHFDALTKVAASVPVRVITRPRNSATHSAVTDAIVSTVGQAHLLS